MVGWGYVMAKGEAEAWACNVYMMQVFIMSVPRQILEKGEMKVGFLIRSQ